MMPNHLMPIPLVALAVLFTAGGAAAQALPPAAGPSDPSQAAMAELQQTQQQLGQLQIQAISGSTELEAQRSTIDEMLLDAAELRKLGE